MGRKKLIVCNLTFDDNETIEEKILKMFSPENLINCFSETNYESYKKVIDHANIQMILNDEELMTTIFAFFENSLNTSVTSSKTFMHRNTLNYRLDKVKKLTGLNLKQFEHAVVFKNLIIINDIIKSFNDEQ
ncbi:MAG: helix-turn-helix domain-containing protein [Clostridia bacterium]|jgi:sugar diacid utilization regulator|nr:helix-turn-helix domain-containing protein [Clostridia bacterium]